MIFQAMFAIITPALITGAFAERMRFKAFFVFMILWATIVYNPVAHWVWGAGGWLGNLGALDFAGGTVVHICSGVAALCCALVLGKRKGYGREEFTPHNLTMTLIGTALLWFGWFGFNAGSALGANGLAANAFVVTNTARRRGDGIVDPYRMVPPRQAYRPRRRIRRGRGLGRDHTRVGICYTDGGRGYRC